MSWSFYRFRTRLAAPAPICWGSAAVCALLLSACGKDKPDYDSIKGEHGAVPGSFNLRLAQGYRDEVDSLQAKIADLLPGLTPNLTQRFAGNSASTDKNGTLLSDLLKLDVPATDSDVVNKRIMGQLSDVSGDKGAYFDKVDTEKYLSGPTMYEPVPADPDMADQYYLDMIHWQAAVASITLPMLSNPSPVVVAVLDTGVFANHEDLTNVMWQNKDGAVGYDATTDTPLAKSECKDDNGHGTHVAGLIGAEGKNGKGIHGVGFVLGRDGVDTKQITEIMAVKVLNANGAGTSEVISKGIKWAVDQHRSQKTDASEPERAKQNLIINMSLGGPFDTDGYHYKKNADGSFDFEDDVLNYATANGDVLVVVAAGNDSCGIGGACDLYGDSYKETYYYPCSYANVLCVAATTHKDTLAGFSNRQASVGIAAPGYEILSTIPDGDQSAYGYFNGTSQATPVTSGAAAVLWYLYPDFTATEIKSILQKSASNITDITQEIDSGYGRLDLNAALAYAKQLKAANKKPDAQAPAAGIVSAEKVTPSKAPPAGTDPDAKSQNAVGSSTESKGHGSASGCAVIQAGEAGAAPSSFALALLLAGALLPFCDARSKAD